MIKMSNKKQKSDNDYIENEMTICPFTGKKYDAVKKIKCECECHKSNNIIHFAPCCDNGYIEKYRYIE